MKKISAILIIFALLMGLIPMPALANSAGAEQSDIHTSLIEPSDIAAPIPLPAELAKGNLPFPMSTALNSEITPPSISVFSDDTNPGMDDWLWDIAPINPINWMYHAADRYAGGNGTAANPYLIATPQQLARMAKDVYYNITPYHFKLTNNINLAGKRWLGVGIWGSFDGNGKTISGMNYPLWDENGVGGFTYGFGTTGEWGVIKNLTVDITGVTTYFQGTFGNYPGGLIENCKVIGNVNIRSNSDISFFSYSNSGIIRNCELKGNFSAESSTGDIRLAGFAFSNSYDSVLENCTVNANISGKGRSCGVYGFSYHNDSAMNNCRMSGNITSHATGSLDYSGVEAFGLYCFDRETTTASNCTVNANIKIIGNIRNYTCDPYTHRKYPINYQSNRYDYCSAGYIGQVAGLSFRDTGMSSCTFVGSITTPLGTVGETYPLLNNGYYNGCLYPTGGVCTATFDYSKPPVSGQYPHIAIPRMIEIGASRTILDTRSLSGGGGAYAPYVPPEPAPLKTSDVTINVIDKSGQPVSGAEVILGGIEETTDAYGKAMFLSSNAIAFGTRNLSVDKNGYESYSETLNIQSSVLEKTVKLGSSIRDVSISISGGARSLLTGQDVYIDQSDDLPYMLTANTGGQAAWLVSGSGRRMQFFDGTLWVNFHSEGFAENERFFVESGSERVQLRLYISDAIGKLKQALQKPGLLNTNGYDIGQLWPLLNGMSFKLDSGALGVDIEPCVSVADGKVTIDFKGELPVSVISDHVNAMLALTGTFPLAQLQNDGTSEFGIGLSLEGDVLDVRHQIIVVTPAGPVPISVRLKMGAQIGAQGTVKYNDNFGNVPIQLEFVIPIGAELEAFLGLGVPWILNAGVYGKAEASVKFVFESGAGTVENPGITGSFGLYLEALSWTVQKQLFPGEAQTRLFAASSSDWQPIGREYLNFKNVAEMFSEGVVRDGGGGGGGGRLLPSNMDRTILDNNIFPNTYSKPYGEHIYVLTDNSSREFAVNGLMLTKDGVPMRDDGTADGLFDVSGNFVVWEDNKAVLPENSDFAASMAGKEISFSSAPKANPIRLTNNNYLDFAPVAADYNGNVLVAWLSNTTNDMFMQEGITSVHYAVYNGAGFGAVQTIANVGAVSGLSVSYNSGGAYLSYGAEGNIYLVEAASGNTQEIAQDGRSGILFGDSIAYITDAGIEIRLIDGNLLGTIDAPNAKQISVVENSGNTTLLWLEPLNGFDALYASWFDASTNTWSEKSLILSGNYDVKNYGAYWESNGDIEITYLEAEKAYFDGDEFKIGKADLCKITLTPDVNIAIKQEGITFDELLYGSSATAAFTVPVVNNGQKTIAGFNLKLYDGDPSDGVVVANGQYASSLKPGERTDLFIWGQLMERGVKNIYVEVLPLNATDIDLLDNTVSYRIGNPLISITEAYFEESGDNYVFNAGVQNLGGSESAPITVTLSSQADGSDVIDTEIIDSLLSSEEQKVQWIIPKSQFGVIDSYKSLYLTVKSGGVSNTMLAVLTAPFVSDSLEVFLSGAYETPNNETIATAIDVANDSDTDLVNAALITAIHDEDGKLVSFKKETLNLPAGETITAHPITLSFTKELREVQDPNYPPQYKEYKFKALIWGDMSQMNSLLSHVPTGDVVILGETNP